MHEDCGAGTRIATDSLPGASGSRGGIDHRRAGQPLARLLPYELTSSPRVLGLGQGEAKIPDDFDRIAADAIAV
jgi:hypothetical protein